MKLSLAWRKHGARFALGVMLTLAAAVLCLAGSENIARLDAMLGDWRMRLDAPQLDRRIVIVDIDEQSLARVGRFPWSRDVQARLVRQLTGHYGVAALGFDISFPEADTSSGYAVLQGLARGELAGVAGLPAQLEKLRPAMDYDGLFAGAMRGQPVVLGYSVSGQQRKGVLPKPAFTVADLNGRTVTAYVARGYEANIAPLQAAAQGAGIFTALTDADGAVIVTEWDELSGLLTSELRDAMRTPLIVDGRNLLDPGEARAAGFVYESIGRAAHDFDVLLETEEPETKLHQ